MIVDWEIRGVALDMALQYFVETGCGGGGASHKAAFPRVARMTIEASTALVAKSRAPMWRMEVIASRSMGAIANDTPGS